MGNTIYLIIAAFCLVAGLFIYFHSIKQEHSKSTVIIGWLLIALFPVFVIFHFFPESTAKGDMLNFEFGGAFAAFIFIWWFGSKKAMHGISLDQLEKENEKLKEKISNTPQNTTVRQKEKLLTETKKYIYDIEGTKNKKIGIVTGTISNVNDIDVWVNSENTNMQMARFYESSISAIIRYLGAEKDKFRNVTNDIIANSLKEELEGNLSVQPKTVLVTSSGELLKSNNVKKIFHVASVQGEVGLGYKPISDIHNCIKTVLDKIESTNDNLETVLFPLLGTNTAKGNLSEIVSKLFSATLTHYESNKDSKIAEVLFLAYTDIQLKHCLTALGDDKRLTKRA